MGRYSFAQRQLARNTRGGKNAWRKTMGKIEKSLEKKQERALGKLYQEEYFETAEGNQNEKQRTGTH